MRTISRHHGIFDVTRLHHEHYATERVSRYRLDVWCAMHVCGKEEVLEAVNGNLVRGGNTSSDGRTKRRGQ